MATQTYVATSTNLDGADLVIAFVCVCLWDDGRCAFATGEVVDHAMLESYTSADVRRGRHVASEGSVSLHLTSRSRHDRHTDEDGWTESTRTPDVEVDVTFVFERRDEHTLTGLGEEGEALTLSDEVSLPAGVAFMLT